MNKRLDVLKALEIKQVQTSKKKTAKNKNKISWLYPTRLSGSISIIPQATKFQNQKVCQNYHKQKPHTKTRS